MKKALALVAENVNGGALLIGWIWLFIGLRQMSPPVADIVTGILLMALGAYPYVRRLKRRP